MFKLLHESRRYLNCRSWINIRILLLSWRNLNYEVETICFHSLDFQQSLSTTLKQTYKQNLNTLEKTNQHANRVWWNCADFLLNDSWKWKKKLLNWDTIELNQILDVCKFQSMKLILIRKSTRHAKDIPKVKYFRVSAFLTVS